MSVALLIAVLAFAGCARPGSTTPSPVTSTAPAEPEARLVAPADGSSVHQCAIFTGTAHLPTGKTLVLSMRNLDNFDPNHYFEAVKDYDYPGELGAWTGYQWFGSGDSSVGQHYRVELLIVDLSLVKTALAKSKKDGWFAPNDLEGSVLVAHITVTRVAGPGPVECT
jgi:serine/threonine-protein kinase